MKEDGAAGNAKLRALFDAQIAEMRAEFESLLSDIGATEDLQEQRALARRAITLAVEGSTGYYSSDVIEGVYLRWAQSLHIPLAEHYVPRSVLHVMTQGYTTGGHTRVVERWVRDAPPGECHSVVLTDQDPDCELSCLRECVAQKQGRFVQLERNLSEEQKALLLRELASDFERVVLHVHMDDVVPLVAFGTPEFRRPVYFYNHADYKFWLGVSVADHILQLHTWGIQLSATRRGVSDPFVLGIPVDPRGQNSLIDREQQRQKWGYGERDQVIMTVGGWHKYKPLMDLDFSRVADRLLQENPYISVMSIGIEPQRFAAWRVLAQRYGRRFRMLPPMPHQEMMAHLVCADLVLDSFPMGGGTALIDAISCGCPVLSLKCPIGQLDYAEEAGIICPSPQVLVQRSCELLENPELLRQNHDRLCAALSRHLAPQVWQERLRQLPPVPGGHRIRPFKTPAPLPNTLLDYYLLSEGRREKTKIALGRFFRLSSLHYSGRKSYILRLFGHDWSL